MLFHIDPIAKLKRRGVVQSFIRSLLESMASDNVNLPSNYVSVAIAAFAVLQSFFFLEVIPRPQISVYVNIYVYICIMYLYIYMYIYMCVYHIAIQQFAQHSQRRHLFTSPSIFFDPAHDVDNLILLFFSHFSTSVRGRTTL